MAERMFVVKNRSASRVGYYIPEDNIRRTFAPGEPKTLPESEIMKLSYQPGGKELMVSFLQVQEAMLDKMGINPQPEYYMSEQQIKDVMLNGSLDAFLDCLDFAPPGVQDLIRQYAVTLPLTDLYKRKALKEKTGFDVDKAIALAEADKAPETAAPAQTATPAVPAGRRTAGNYKPVEKVEKIEIIEKPVVKA